MNNQPASNYAPVTPAVLDALTQILGAGNVLVDRERIESYSHDETSAEEYGHMPEVVVTPTTTEQVAAVVMLANRERIPVTPRGAGSGLSGGAIPIYGGILLSVEKLNRVLEIDYDNMVVVAESGVVTNEINALVAEKKLFYAGYPMSLETCFLGGNIAEGYADDFWKTARSRSKPPAGALPSPGARPSLSEGEMFRRCG